MKWPFYYLLLTIFSCTQFAARSPSSTPAVEERHVVFDIDWTIVSEVKNPNETLKKNKRLIKVNESYYFINEGLEEFIDDLIKRKEIKISFYSGGSLSRNNELLSKIKLKNGKSLKDIAYKVLSFDDLVPVNEVLPTARFAERYKKDLRKISKDLDQLIMFDDTVNFVVDSADNQAEHVFFIGKAFEYFEKFEDAEGLSGEYIPKTQQQWLLNNKKLNVLNMAFNDAYAEAVQKGITLSEAMKKREELYNFKDHEWTPFSELSYRKYKAFRMGEIKIPVSDCKQMLKSINAF